MEYSFELHFRRDLYAKRNNVVKVLFDGDVVAEDVEITEHRVWVPSKVSFTINKEPGEYQLEVYVTNGTFLDDATDTDVYWDGTLVNEKRIYWEFMNNSRCNESRPQWNTHSINLDVPACTPITLPLVLWCPETQ